MDRLFILEEKYVNDKYNPDGTMLLHLLNAYARQYLDEYMIVQNIDIENIAIEKAEQQGKRIIPVGPLEFVKKRLQQETKNENAAMPPIEIPDGMEWNANREYKILLGKDIPKDIVENGKKWFLKDADHLKQWNNLLVNGSSESMINPDTRYVVSERVEIVSEHRVFVYMDEVQEIRNYSGSHLLFPDISVVESCINDYRIVDANRPAAYTMDFMRFQGCTGLIEIHPFVSCGLYGFYDSRILDMLDKGYEWYIQQNRTVSQRRRNVI